MAEIILLPRLSDSMTEGIVSKWLVSIGDWVKRGDVIAEVDTDKATMELETYKEGYMLFLAPEGKLSVNELLAIIGEKDEDISALLSNHFRDSHSSKGMNDASDRPVRVDNQEINSFLKIRENGEGVIGVEKDAFEVAMLLTQLSLQSGMMVGLFGRWGRGKTFFWKRIWQYFAAQTKNPFYKVEFQAWQYQQTPATWAYLYEKLSESFMDSSASKKWLRYIHRLWKTIRLNFRRKGFFPLFKLILIALFSTLAATILKVIASTNAESVISHLITYLGIPVALLTSLYAIGQSVKKEYSSTAKDVFNMYVNKYSFKDSLGLQAEIQKEIVKLLKLWIPLKRIGHKRVLLFIDDLDRCNEQKVLQIIDALRVMLDEPEIAKRVVIIVAVDERILKLAINNKYSSLTINDLSIPDDQKRNFSEKLVREYMDKLFIAGIRLKNLTGGERIEILRAYTKGKINQQKNPAASKPIFEGVTILDVLNDISEDENLPSKISEFELNFFELELLDNSLLQEPELTPRAIRIFYYRYLLAKRFLVHRFEANKELEMVWHHRTNKQILPHLILLYSMRRNTESLYSDFAEVIGKERKEIELYNQQFVIEKHVFIELLTVVDTVVAY